MDMLCMWFTFNKGEKTDNDDDNNNICKAAGRPYLINNSACIHHFIKYRSIKNPERRKSKIEMAFFLSKFC